MFADYVAGITGGIAVVCVGHPFDTTKTRLQVAPFGYYSSAIDCVKKTWDAKGIQGFYSGLTAPLMGQMFFRSASFGTYFHSVRLLSGPNVPSSLDLVIAGGTTGFVISFIETPIDLVKTKLQSQIFLTSKPEYTNTFQCANHIVKRHGFFALWQGWLPTAVRNVPANALFFPVNELLKRYFARALNVQETELPTPYRLLSGACAGLGYWVGTYPLDVIKGRVQSQEYEARMGWSNTARRLYAEGGYVQFSRGLGPCAARAIPACAAMFTTVDLVRNHVAKYLD